MIRSTWNLLVLSAANGHPLQPVQLQKCLFILGQKFPGVIAAENYYSFQPYNYGAFDPDVYSDAETLENQGLVRITRSPGGWKEFAATAQGMARAAEVEKTIPPSVANYVRRLVDWARSLSFSEIVKAVYEAYPETKAKSIFKG